MAEADNEISKIFDVGKQSRAELREYDRSLRERFPHRVHDGWQPDDNRPDPVALLRSQDAIRIPELIAPEYRLSFSFY